MTTTSLPAAKPRPTRRRSVVCPGSSGPVETEIGDAQDADHRNSITGSNGDSINLVEAWPEYDGQLSGASLSASGVGHETYLYVHFGTHFLGFIGGDKLAEFLQATVGMENADRGDGSKHAAVALWEPYPQIQPQILPPRTNQMYLVYTGDSLGVQVWSHSFGVAGGEVAQRFLSRTWERMFIGKKNVVMMRPKSRNCAPAPPDRPFAS